jgi:hypothetical protein
MRNREFILAHAIVGAVAWTAKADGPIPIRDLAVTGTLTVAAANGQSSIQLWASEKSALRADSAGQSRVMGGISKEQ